VTERSAQIVIRPSAGSGGAPASNLAHVLEAAERSEAAAVVVDLRACHTVDSTSLGVLLRAHQRLRADGRTLAVIAHAPEIAQAFRITGLDRQLNLSVAES
jgi:anti-sigma B factor antagonist